MDKRILWLAAMFCSALLFLMMFVSLGAAERQVNRLVAHVEELEQQVYDRDEIIAAQQRLIAAYQEQNMAVAGVLGQASDALEGIAYGPYTREEVQAKIMAVADVIAEVNHILALDQVQAISHSIVTCAVAADIDPMLLTAMAITESECRPKARGRAGEYGLLQVMPGTGKWIAGRLGYADYHPEQMLDVRTNIQYAAYYLKVVTKEFGDVDKGILAYNRGSNGARNWLKAHEPSANSYVCKVQKIYKEVSPWATSCHCRQSLSRTTAALKGGLRTRV